MLILRLWNYFRGYVIIRIEGLSLERFINMCIAKGIYLWDIQRLDYTTMEAKVGVKGFKGMRRLARRSGCKIHISKKHGYPFRAHKLKKRKMLLMGAFFSCIVLIITSTFVFTIDVVGNEKVSDEEILEVLEEAGFTNGVNRYFIDLKDIEDTAMMKIHDLAWIGIEIKGIRARVEVVEKVTPPPVVKKDEPCDVIAKKNGVIEEVIARNGDAVVKKGDIVSKGDLLITGKITRETLETPLYVHAYGEVYAKTYYEASKSKKLVEIKKKKTGEVYTRKIFRVGQLELSLSRGEVPYPVYILEKNVKAPLRWRNKGLPVEIIEEDYYKAVEIEEKLNLDEVKKDIHDALVQELMKKIPDDAEILNTKVDFEVKDKILYGNITIEALEDIAVQTKLEIEKLEIEEDNNW